MSQEKSWSRAELKEQAKVILGKYYWRIFFVTVFLSILIDSDSMVLQTAEKFCECVQELFLEERFPTMFLGFGIFYIDSSGLHIDREALEQLHLARDTFWLSFFMALFLAVLFYFGVKILISIFIANPLRVGSIRFLNKSFEKRPELKELFYGFEHNYRNVVYVMFVRILRIFLWCLLLIVPGIVKSYEYTLVPFLLANRSKTPADEAFSKSKMLMQGQKHKLFLLDLSFLGWHFLSAVTLGLLGIVFVLPYTQLVRTAFCRKVCGIDTMPDNVYYDGMD
ncbi:MAG: DUF975 family protein [Clostridiaceae bacterium]|nr:DUF975 family protein [Clostridiaceae bacterium]